MKTDSPYDRGDIHINKNDKVLEIGPGHNPTYRSNVRKPALQRQGV